MKFRSKPMIIEAIKFMYPFSLDEMIEEWGIDFMKKCENSLCGLYIDTLEGRMLAEFGDWIIKGTEGEFYPCKDVVFKKKYEPVGDDEK